MSAKVGVPFHAVQEILSAPTVADREQTARMHVAQRLGLETFQRSDAIGSALSMVGVARVWATAFPPPATSPAKQLDLIVARRNRIVHQGDSDPVSLGAPTPIGAEDALDAVSTVEVVVRTIDPLC